MATVLESSYATSASTPDGYFATWNNELHAYQIRLQQMLEYIESIETYR